MLVARQKHILSTVSMKTGAHRFTRSVQITSDFTVFPHQSYEEILKTCRESLIFYTSPVDKIRIIF
jgi:hypothetical protein